MANGLNVDENTFELLDSKKQNTILFKNTERILLLLECKNKQCDLQIKSCGDHFKKIEKSFQQRKFTDKAFAGVSGFIGGILTVVGKYTIFK